MGINPDTSPLMHLSDKLVLKGFLWCIQTNKQRSFPFPDTQIMVYHKSRALHLYLLFVVGCVRQQSRHMEHDLIVLVSCEQGVSARGIRCKKNSETHCTITTIHFSHMYILCAQCFLCKTGCNFTIGQTTRQ